jgi:imidazolonepropionase-like amidohydrolase
MTPMHQSERAAVIRGGQVLDAVSATIMPNAGVSIRDGRIAVEQTVDARVIDADGLVLMPGLIDCHVHLGLSLEPLETQLLRSPTDHIVETLRRGRELLEMGVTTARDAGGATAGIARAFASGEFLGPRLQVSVGWLSQTGGHGDQVMASGVDRWPAASDLPRGVADGVDQVRAAARAPIRAGADWLKVMATGGVLSPSDDPNSTGFTVEELAVVVEEARSARLRGVLAHCTNAQGTKNALRAGIRSIEHGDGIDEEGIEMMLASDAVLVPTLAQTQFVASPEYLEQQYVPTMTAEQIVPLARAQRALVAEVAERGIRIAMGTDWFSGIYAPAEIAYMAEFGLGAAPALRAATIESARLLGLKADLGRLLPGMRGDLIGLAGDPLAAPERFADPGFIRLVVKGGDVVVDRR